MTRTLEFSPEMEARLQALALARSTSVEEAARQVLEQALEASPSDEELDEVDAAWWRREQASYDPSQNIAWDKLEAEMDAEGAT